MKKINVNKELDKMIKTFSKDMDKQMAQFNLKKVKTKKSDTPYLDYVFYFIAEEERKQREECLNGFKVFQT